MTPRRDVLDRVRDARPPGESDVDRAELWGRITATPPGPAADRGRAASRRRELLRMLPPVVATLLTVAIAAAALVFLRHGPSHPSRPATSPATRGAILDSQGALLSTGQAGLEATYSRFLRAGDNVKLTLDTQLQRVGEKALARSIRLNSGRGGAFVVLNPDTGGIYAMGSTGASPLNRAFQSAGPVGSVFTPITALAALQSGAWSPDATFDDTGQYCVGSGAAEQCRHNSGHAVRGTLNVADALRVASNDFFFNLGARLNEDPDTHPEGGPLDTWARALGIGARTGVDLPGEIAGTLPNPQWRQQRNTLEAQCDDAAGPFAYTNGRQVSARMHPGWRRSPRHAPGACGIADGTNRPWSIGDNESLAVGQGDVQVTPLQLAVAYGTLANGGTVVRPHLAADVQAQDGTVLHTINPAPARHLAIKPSDLDAIRQGLTDAATKPGGSSDDVMGTFPLEVYGQAGSAEYDNQADDAWYAGFVTDTTHPVVVVVRVQGGGFGDVAAAPVARQLLSQWLFGRPGAYRAGTWAGL